MDGQCSNRCHHRQNSYCARQFYYAELNEPGPDQDIRHHRPGDRHGRRDGRRSKGHRRRPEGRQSAHRLQRGGGRNGADRHLQREPGHRLGTRARRFQRHRGRRSAQRRQRRRGHRRRDRDADPELGGGPRRDGGAGLYQAVGQPATGLLRQRRGGLHRTDGHQQHPAAGRGAPGGHRLGVHPVRLPGRAEWPCRPRPGARADHVELDARHHRRHPDELDCPCRSRWFSDRARVVERFGQDPHLLEPGHDQGRRRLRLGFSHGRIFWR